MKKITITIMKLASLVKIKAGALEYKMMMKLGRSELLKGVIK